jgi:hypothetical protein
LLGLCLPFADPIYYDYGPGDNVVYRNKEVYINDGLVGTTDAYTKSVFALANASPAIDATSDQPDEWLPLGTFAVLRNDDDNKPSQTLQLAMNKNGSISGVLFDLPKDTSTPIHGSLDRTMQRVTFDLGPKSGLVAETGIYNLTQDEATLLVHKEGEKPQTYTRSSASNRRQPKRKTRTLCCHRGEAMGRSLLVAINALVLVQLPAVRASVNAGFDLSRDCPRQNDRFSSLRQCRVWSPPRRRKPPLFLPHL